MLRGCPECEVTIAYADFIEELDDELARHAEKQELCVEGEGRTYKWPWSRDKLIRDVGSISAINARVDGKGYLPDWTIPMKNLVMIVREEQVLQDRIDRDEALREAKRKTNGGRGD